jgi:hypothetical protein
MGKINGTPLTIEFFTEEMLPRIEEVLDQKFTVFEEKTANELKDINTKILESEEHLIGRLQGIENQLTIATHQYQRTNRRVDKIDSHLGINTNTDW